MSGAVLITGGAGFIGSHLADALLQRGRKVRVLDNLDSQVHGEARRRPDYLDADVELVGGDIRDADAVKRALDGVDTVFHLAACVGVGQSMYDVARYTDVNNRGTAVLLQALIEHPVERLVVASSMSIYGEGLYRAADGTVTPGTGRSLEQLRNHRWELEECSARRQPADSRARRRAGVRAGDGESARSERRSVQRRQRPQLHRARSGPQARRGPRQEDRAGDHRDVSRRRHPPLLRRHLPRARAPRI